ncbi:DUF357 domain-containing protein [Candidatus Micrarchaeota archaeon]|nr:DUF357 domain-containing protein [Candidatus Micrarchaeota archaeon]
MKESERSEKDIKKLEKIIEKFRGYGLDSKYPAILEYALNYLEDAKHYHENEDYFTSFGCANYSYGIIEGIIFREKGIPR